MKHYQVKNASSGVTFVVNEGESVLSAALRQGVMLPYSCKNGTCGSCKGQLESGEVHYPTHPPMALGDGETESDKALFCQAVPTSDLVIRAREIEAVRDIQVRKMPARVIDKTLLAPDVIRIRLKLPAAQRLQFLAGQYLEILLADGKRRAFSIASPPHYEDVIELHIRRVDGGGFTSWVFDELQERDILRLEAPLGTFFVRNDNTQRPLIMAGGGTGFAPLKSMIECLLEHGDKRPLHLFWGAETAADLYMHEQVKAWAKHNDHIHYTSALSKNHGSEHTNSFKGLVQEAVVAHHADLSAFDIYISGPPAMVESGRAAFIENGAEKRRIFFDSFEFGLDVPVRVLSKPH